MLRISPLDLVPPVTKNVISKERKKTGTLTDSSVLRTELLQDLPKSLLDQLTYEKIHMWSLNILGIHNVVNNLVEPFIEIIMD